MGNPVFSSSDTFNGRRNAQPSGYGYQQPGGYPPPGYQQGGYQQQPQTYQQEPTSGGVMTLDDVLIKTAITLAGVFALAAATFVLLPIEMAFPAALLSALVGFVTVWVVARRPNISIGGVLFYAAIEGVFVGAFSKVFETMWPGIVFSAVLATFITAFATLAAYKFFNIRVSAKFRKTVILATMATAGVMLVNLVLVLFGVDVGIRAAGPGAGLLAIGVSILCVVLAVMNLIVDFDYVERGIASRAPARESWRAALGITVTMVWLYTELLRILSYFRN